jgi:hypothetical protein
MAQPLPAEPATWTVRPLSVHVLLEGRRKPVAMVRLAVGPLEVVVAVSQLKKLGLAVRAPMFEGGTPTVGTAPEVWATIEKAADGGPGARARQAAQAGGWVGDGCTLGAGVGALRLPRPRRPPPGAARRKVFEARWWLARGMGP